MPPPSTCHGVVFHMLSICLLSIHYFVKSSATHRYSCWHYSPVHTNKQKTSGHTSDKAYFTFLHVAGPNNLSLCRPILFPPLLWMCLRNNKLADQPPESNTHKQKPILSRSIGLQRPILHQMLASLTATCMSFVVLVSHTVSPQIMHTHSL